MRSFVFLVSLVMTVIGCLRGKPVQAQLSAPWEGQAQVTQGNLGSTSHNICGQRAIDPNNCNWENTYAIDVKLSCGSYVLASTDGKVVHVDADPMGMGGRELAVAYTNGPVRVYLHLSTVLVSINQSVKRGQVIALSGNSSNGDGGVGCHLHFHDWSGNGSYSSHTKWACCRIWY